MESELIERSKEIEMKRFGFCAMLLVAAACAVFAGGGTDKPSVKAGSGEVTITYWSFPNFAHSSGVVGKFDEEMIAAFEAKNPGIKVKLETITFNDGPAKIEVALASKTGPDLTYDAPGRIITWANMGVLSPLDDIVNPVASTIAPGLLNGSKGGDGKYYMYPIHTGVFPMAFNKEMLEDLGLLDMLPYKTADRTWTVAQYEALLRALKDKLPKGVTPGVFFAKSSAGDQASRAFLANLYGNANLLNAARTEYTMNSPAAVKNLDWTVNAIKNGLLTNGSALAASDAIDLFVYGNAAHAILFSTLNDKLNKDKKSYKGKPFTVIYMPFPNDTGKPALEYLIGGPCVFNNGDPQKVEAAKKFIQFMATDAEWAPKLIAASGSFACSSKIVQEISDPEIKWCASATKFYGPYYNTIKGFAEMRTFWFPALQAAINGTPSKVALDEFVAKANATLK